MHRRPKGQWGGCVLGWGLVFLTACLTACGEGAESTGGSQQMQTAGNGTGAGAPVVNPVPPPPPPPPVQQEAAASPAPMGPPASTVQGGDGSSVQPMESEYAHFTTGEIDLPAGKERYICHTMTLTEPTNVDRFEYDALPGVHHFLLARTTKKEQEGTFECDILFRFSWIPVFGAGSGSQELQLPDGAAQVFPAGTQLLIQLHLFNAGDEDLRQKVGIRMHKSTVPEPKPVGIYAFGTDEIALPAAGPSSVVNECEVPTDVTLFAALPHMHYLGRSLVMELQDPTTGVFNEVYRREPWDFDAQYVEPMMLEIPKGTNTRVTCNYMNDNEHVVNFGESSADEMCFLVAYQVGGVGLNGCVKFDPKNLSM
ncbi:MAG: hypothetical protein OXU20_34355 [Myxococcales bacterium]|nr:hypothetical protein [Myxococcales bacterium]